MQRIAGDLKKAGLAICIKYSIVVSVLAFSFAVVN